MAKKILIVGFELASDEVTHEDFDSKVSLLDWDIVLFRPQITDFISDTKQYQGKPSLDGNQSSQLKEACEHWHREVHQAIEAGKTVIVYLPPVEEVYIDTGERQYSGTGRNRATTHLVTIYNNYKCIPAALEPTTSHGTAVKLAPKGTEILAGYWADFGALSEYKVLLNSKMGFTCLLTKNGDKPVGLLLPSKNSTGSLLCLPDINFYHSTFIEEDESEFSWTEEAKQFAARLVSSIAKMDDVLRSQSNITPVPFWATNDSFFLPAESKLHSRLLEVEIQLNQLQRSKESLTVDLNLAGQLRSLLYEKGKPLEKSIIDALRLLGFEAEPFNDGTSEFDVVFQSKEGRLIGEAEGKDLKAINVDKLRQLTMNIHEDLQREEITTPAKGVLFGNGFRLIPLTERGVQFTEKCIVAARSSGIALIATQELFTAAQYLSGEKDEAFAGACRKALLCGVGLTSFPAVPAQADTTIGGTDA